MSSSISSIKSRIKSVNSTKKITGAMKSVSTVKLNRMSKTTLKNREYKDVLHEAAKLVVNSPCDFDSIYTKQNESNKQLYIVYTSDVGLCGSYNLSIVKYLHDNVKKDDYVYLIGTSSYNVIKKEGFNIVNEMIVSDDITYFDMVKVFNKASDMFSEGKIGKVNIIYNKYINSITYKTSEIQVLPFVKDDAVASKEVILEPDPNEIFDSLLLLLLKNEMYNTFLESKTSEQVARRFAMENATKNAEDLITDLTLDYNKARQGSITQEITEIVSGANAI